MKKIITISWVLLAALLTACGTVPSSSGAMQIGPDTYRIIARAPLAKATESQRMAFSEGNSFCSSLGKKLTTTATRDAGNSGFEITFRCLKDGDPDLVRPTLERTPDTIIKIK